MREIIGAAAHPARTGGHLFAIIRTSQGHRSGLRRKEMSAQVLEESRFAEGNGTIFARFSAANRPKTLRFVRKTMKMDTEFGRNRAKAHAAFHAGAARRGAGSGSTQADLATHCGIGADRDRTRSGPQIPRKPSRFDSYGWCRSGSRRRPGRGAPERKATSPISRADRMGRGRRIQSNAFGRGSSI